MKELILKTRAFNEMFMELPYTGDKVELIYNRIRLLKEEISELKEAVLINDRKEMLDALLDLLFLTFGTIDLLGFTEEIEAGFNEVDRTNMNKFVSSLNEAEKTAEYYKNNGIECNYKFKNGKYAILRDFDGKLLKPIGWEGPKL